MLSSEPLGTKENKCTLDTSTSTLLEESQKKGPSIELQKEDKYESTEWSEFFEKAIKSIVSIKFSMVEHFDTEVPGNGEGTGFIVDAEQGIILTNRHIVGPGPFVGEAILYNHEEIKVYPVYRDPVHDFGFLRFDPKQVKFLKLNQISLRPDLARIGLDISVVGNDAGERLSILSGSISRLNRNAPDYGQLTYNDFNTFYIQAASNSSGGSSGSPVLDIDGNAVALQAGGRNEAATNFFLPLERVKRALKYIQAKETVPRGTIQTRFLHRPYDEVHRLGLRDSTEAEIRAMFPSEIGMLTVETVLPEGPAHNVLRIGDVLVSVDGNHLTSFSTLDDLLDSKIGDKIKLIVERGGKPKDLEISVQDLHSITPNRYLYFCGATFNDLSYQLARAFSVPCQGVHVSNPAGSFALHGAGAGTGTIVTSVDDIATPNLDTFIQVVGKIPDGKQVQVVSHILGNLNASYTFIVKVDRKWSDFRLATRNDLSGLWDFSELAEPLPSIPIEPKTVIYQELHEDSAAARLLKNSFVKIDYQLAATVEGFSETNCQDGGWVLDATLGLVVASRTCVPYDLGDISLTFASSVTLPAKVVFLHPTHNFAMLKYDPSLLGQSKVYTPQISSIKLCQGDKVDFIGVNRTFRLISASTSVSQTMLFESGEDSKPHYRSINLDYILPDSRTVLYCQSGLLADSQGKIQGLWVKFLGNHKSDETINEYYLGIDISVVLPVLEFLQGKTQKELRILDVELASIDLVEARHRGLSDEWATKFELAVDNRREVYEIVNIAVGSTASQFLKERDIILSINDKIFAETSDLSVQNFYSELNLTILRAKELLELNVPTSKMDGLGLKRIISWSGALIHEPHYEVLLQSQTLPSRVYVEYISQGSPASMYDMSSPAWIIAVNDTPTPDLDSFLEAIKQLKDNEYVRVQTISFNAIPSVISIKTNMHYWPTTELVKESVHSDGDSILDVEAKWKKIRHY